MLVCLVALATCFYLPDKDTSSYVIILQCFTDTGRHSNMVSECVRVSDLDATLNVLNEGCQYFLVMEFMNMYSALCGFVVTK